MFNTIPFKQKNKYLKFGSVILLLFIWQFSIRNTINLRAEVNTQLQFNNQNSGNISQYYQLKDRLRKLNSLLNAGQSANQTKGQLSTISDLATEEKVKVVAIPFTGADSTKRIFAKTELQGDFIHLLRFLDKYEAVSKSGISTVSFLKPQVFNESEKKTVKLICM
ncbi:hypothetical protein [Solitalea canadensis]|uniref:Uncharacterized protein n=1 Tax=Solitalea canadensis (strain ATCC 29591 / DSM 3403 / JCM 21819 / LMG 8368 / NBRC 15130 / NCIMB 12057 / USAM 9D) TaxID=929556 RepID=H8KTR6_SOLCM|nr:hypothetical protein [Solitalea canadensis]AFD06641.1 hypothetical protein Solca_1568 [Solitalea canadensis DSM 3403]